MLYELLSPSIEQEIDRALDCSLMSTSAANPILRRLGVAGSGSNRHFRPSHAKVHGKQPEEQDTLVDMHTTKQIPKQQVYMLTLVSLSHTASASNHDKMA